jgi:GT2 family glycosyltransferase
LKKIAVLITSYNRKEKTIQCIKQLIQCDIPKYFKVDIFLLDDNSPDKTGVFIKNEFPQVHTINGTGELFWSGGMRNVWEFANSNGEFDFFLWLNDDTYLFSDAISKVIETYYEQNKKCIVVGTCKSRRSGKFTYGGRTKDWRPIVPENPNMECYYMNGNFVLIPNKVFKILGNIDGKFTHALGDIDYGLQAKRNSIDLIPTSFYVGICEENSKKTNVNLKRDFVSKLRALKDPKEVILSEYYYFNKKHFGIISAAIASLKALIKIFFPKSYKIAKHLFK